MAYSFGTPTREISEVVDGRQTWIYTVTETGEVATADQWEITGVPSQCTVTLLEANILTPDGVTTIQPELGTITDWTSGGRGHVDKAAAAGDPVRIAQNKRVTQTVDGKLYGRSLPDTTGGASTIIETVLSITLGHI